MFHYDLKTYNYYFITFECPTYRSTFSSGLESGKNIKPINMFVDSSNSGNSLPFLSFSRL